MIYLELFFCFLKVGCCSFGGAYGAIPFIREIVTANGWLNDEMLSYMIAVSESTPGPIMVNLATYIGSTQAGFVGAIIATTAVVLPSFIIILLLTALFSHIWKNKYIQAFLRGMKPGVVGIVLATGICMAVKNCMGTFSDKTMDWNGIIITLLLMSTIFVYRYVKKKKLSPIILLLVSAVAGVFVYGV